MTLARHVQTVVKRLDEHDCMGLAAEMSYNLMMAFAPAFVFIITLLGLVGSSPETLLDILEFANRILPPAALKILRNMMSSIIAGSSGGLAFLSFTIALWAGSNGALSVLKALNRVYGFSGKGKRYYLHQQLIAILLVMLMGLLLFIASNAIVMGNLLLTQLDKFSYLKSHQLTIISTWRWMVTVGLMVIFTAYIYATVPGPTNVHFPLRQTILGASVFVGLWLVVSLAFSGYVENVNQFNQFYDPLTGITVLMIWFFLSCMAFLVGAEVSALCVSKDCLEMEGLADKIEDKIKDLTGNAPKETP